MKFIQHGEFRTTAAPMLLSDCCIHDQRRAVYDRRRAKRLASASVDAGNTLAGAGSTDQATDEGQVHIDRHGTPGQRAAGEVVACAAWQSAGQ